MKIHPTAVISQEAEIGVNVEIGPYVCIEGRAVIGEGSVIHSHAVLSGAVRIGKETRIGHGAIIGTPPQDLAFKSTTHSEVLIGDRNVIRELCTIHRGTAENSVTQVGNDCFLMAGAHLAHNVRIGDGVIIANNSLLGGYVQVGDRAFLGGSSVYHQYVRVGRMALTQGISAFSQDVPPFVIGAERNWIAGLNVIGMRRAGFTVEQRNEIKSAFRLLYKSGLNIREAIQKAREQQWGPEARGFFEFAETAGKRGLCTWYETKRPGTKRQPASESDQPAGEY